MYINRDEYLCQVSCSLAVGGVQAHSGYRCWFRLWVAKRLQPGHCTGGWGGRARSIPGAETLPIPPSSSQFLLEAPQQAEPFLLPRLTSAWGTRARRWPRPALWHAECWEMTETMLRSQNIPLGRKMLQDLQEKAAWDQLEAQASRPCSSILSNPPSGIYFRVFPHPSSSASPRGLPWAFPFAFPPATTSGELRREAAGAVSSRQGPSVCPRALLPGPGCLFPLTWVILQITSPCFLGLLFFHWSNLQQSPWEEDPWASLGAGGCPVPPCSRAQRLLLLLGGGGGGGEEPWGSGRGLRRAWGWWQPPRAPHLGTGLHLFPESSPSAVYRAAATVLTLTCPQFPCRRKGKREP